MKTQLKIKFYFLCLVLFLLLNNDGSYLKASPLLEKYPYLKTSLYKAAESDAKNQVVYVCTGSYAYAYHSNPKCTGLNNCQSEIKPTDEITAVYSMGRKPCCRCWPDATTGCKDDATIGSGGGGGGDNQALGIIAVAVVVSSAAILSNDLYVYSAHSFKKNTDGIVWTMGFRKTFKHSALEYGASVSHKFTNNYYYGYNHINTYKAWGIHTNFVHQLFYNKTPDWLKTYTGVSVNYIDDFGYGGLIGAEFRLKGRLKLDTRYELTSQTNQFQIGLIFKYQKRYLWQKNK